MRPIAILILSLFLVKASVAQSTPQDITRKFFALYKGGDSDKAIDYLFSSNPYSKDIAEGIEDVKRQLKKLVGQIGNYYESDLLATKTAGANVIMYTFLVRHDKQPLTFSIMFYKPNEKWQMQNFKYQNNTSEELEEASKFYRLKENF
ncbi:MAG: hypothetical protein H7068_04220 [Pedobacter sp.]|nr:hypothetical protein [Chitinophagaceae bacterium]